MKNQYDANTYIYVADLSVAAIEMTYFPVCWSDNNCGFGYVDKQNRLYLKKFGSAMHVGDWACFNFVFRANV